MSASLLQVADSIHMAMMTANANETTAPQYDVYGQLHAALQETLRHITHGDHNQAEEIYQRVLTTGEAPSVQYVQWQAEQMAERVMLAQAPANVSASYECRHCHVRAEREFVWTGWFVNNENKGEFYATCAEGHETIRHFPTAHSADSWSEARVTAERTALASLTAPKLTPIKNAGRITQIHAGIAARGR